VSREAIAVGKARYLKLSSLERFTAEWLIEEDVWGPLVDKELVRLAKIRNIVEQGMLPDRVDLDDDGNSEPIPDTSKHWRCDYCPYRTRCDQDGPGRVALTSSQSGHEDDRLVVEGRAPQVPTLDPQARAGALLKELEA
jgi:hypothetical protein